MSGVDPYEHDRQELDELEEAIAPILEHLRRHDYWAGGWLEVELDVDAARRLRVLAGLPAEPAG